MKPSNLQRTTELGTDFWNDSCDIKELSEAVAAGAVGATSNPVIVTTVIESDRERWLPVLDHIISSHPSDTEDEIAERFICEIARQAAAILLPVYERTQGVKGYLSVQTFPHYFRSSDKLIEQGLRFASVAPNIAVKVPAVEAGLKAIEELTAQSISVNATVSFTVSQAIACAEAMEKGKERQRKKVPSYVTLMVGRLDDHLKRLNASKSVVSHAPLLEWAGISVFKRTYALFQERGFHATLLSAAYRSLEHWSEFIGAKAVLTMPYAWWNKCNHANVDVRPRIESPVDEKILNELKKLSDFQRAYDPRAMHPKDFVHFGASTHTLEQFLQGYDKLIAIIRDRILHSA